MDILIYSGLELLGDGVMKLPFLAALRARWPEAPLARPYLNEIIEDAGIGRRPAELLRRPLGDRRFELVIDTQRRVLTTLILRRIRTRCFVTGAADFWLSARRPARDYRRPPSMLGQMLDLIEIAG